MDEKKKEGAEVSQALTQKQATVKFTDEALERFQQLLRNGLLEAATAHEAAEQNNISITTETRIKFRSPLRGMDSAEEIELSGRGSLTLDCETTAKPDTSKKG